MLERSGVVTFQGRPVTLMGPELWMGDRAPDFLLLANDLSTIRLGDSRGRIRLLSIVNSLDTTVCSAQTRRFDELLLPFSADIVSYTVSCDLPFTQNRFRTAHSISHLMFLSDYKDASFGQAYGVLIKEMRLLARSVFIIRPDDRIGYVEVVPEASREPDYDNTLRALQEIINRQFSAAA